MNSQQFTGSVQTIEPIKNCTEGYLIGKILFATLCLVKSASANEFPVVSAPAGVTAVEVKARTTKIISIPFDGAGVPWLSGAETVFVWDPAVQQWMPAEAGTDGGWVKPSGDTLKEESGTPVVVVNSGDASRLVVLSGVVPVEEARAVPLVEGLTLQGNPFGALTEAPVDAKWYRSRLEEGATLRFSKPEAAPFSSAPGAPGIEPLRGSGGRSLTFRITPGERVDVPMVVLMKEVKGGEAGALTPGWMQRAIVAAPPEGIEWEMPLPSAGGEADKLLLVAVTPQVDTDQDGIPDGVEALVLGSDWLAAPGGDAVDDTDSSTLSAEARDARRFSMELQMIQMAGRTIHAPPPAFSVNDSQERTVGEHDRRGRALRRLGLKSVSGLTALQAVSLEMQIKDRRDP